MDRRAASTFRMMKSVRRPGRSLGRVATAAVFLASLLSSGDGFAQAPPGESRPLLPAGERLEYGLSLGPIHGGRASFSVGGPESIDGVEVHRVSLIISGGVPFFALDDRLVSWIASDPLRTVRSERRIHQGRRRVSVRIELSARDRQYRIEPLPGSGEGRSSQPASGPTPAAPLDELAIFFLPRTLRLEPGSVYRVPRYFDGARNPISLRVLGRRRLRTPAGRFDVIELSVEIPGSRLFAPDRHARVFVTDDASRTVVRLTAVTSLGRLGLDLTRRSGPES